MNFVSLGDWGLPEESVLGQLLPTGFFLHLALEKPELREAVSASQVSHLFFLGQDPLIINMTIDWAGINGEQSKWRFSK